MAVEQLSELQLAFLQALWQGEGTVAEVQARLGAAGRALAPTTVATVLRRLENQGWVKHRERGRLFVYRAAVSRQEVSGGVLERITRSLFGGDVPALVSQLLDTRGIEKQDLDAIRALIEARKLKERSRARKGKEGKQGKEGEGR